MLFRRNRNLFGNRNRVVLEALKNLGFTMPQIRKALLDLNDIKISVLSSSANHESHPSTASFSTVISGKRTCKKAQQVIARVLGLSETELF
jgi:hypothetical protein